MEITQKNTLQPIVDACVKAYANDGVVTEREERSIHAALSDHFWFGEGLKLQVLTKAVGKGSVTAHDLKGTFLGMKIFSAADRHRLAQAIGNKPQQAYAQRAAVRRGVEQLFQPACEALGYLSAGICTSAMVAATTVAYK